MSKTVLITGAGTGFGKLAALECAARGHRVIATTESDEQAAALAPDFPQLEVRRLDITTDDIAVADEYEIDVLINNAGAGQTGPMIDVPIERVRRIFEVNVFGTLALTQRVGRAMVERGSGRIIIVSSIAGVAAAPTFGPYSMTKFALEAMGEAMRTELAASGVDVTMINPGPYLTGFNDRMAASMWEWFGSDAATAGATDLFKMVGEFVTNGQMDPTEVGIRLAELVEADVTEKNNFMPPEIAGLVGR